jgi:phospholipase C
VSTDGVIMQNVVKRRRKAFVVAGSGMLALAFSAELAAAAGPEPKTPIRHIVVIYNENISFDHYFGTYPNAANLPGETPFHAAPGTPTVNGLTGALIARNLNSARPFRLPPSQPVTCDMDHAYSAEQKAYHRGLLNRFVEATTEYAEEQKNCDPNLVMAHYDGNTVTALWNYAQHFVLSDNTFGTMFGPSTPGALNLFAAQTAGADQRDLPHETIGDNVIFDEDPLYDDCAGKPNPHERRRRVTVLRAERFIVQRGRTLSAALCLLKLEDTLPIVFHADQYPVVLLRCI